MRLVWVAAGAKGLPTVRWKIECTVDDLDTICNALQLAALHDLAKAEEYQHAMQKLTMYTKEGR